MSVYIIAEAGVNHNGSLENALQMVDVAARAGANAIKFQTYIPELGLSENSPKASYQLETTPRDESQIEMVRRLMLDKKAHEILYDRCRKRNIDFLSTPFDKESVDMLVDDFGVNPLKIASGEITNAPLLWYIAKKGVKIILSTGMSTLGEIEEALSVFALSYTDREKKPSKNNFLSAYFSKEGQDAIRRNITLLHCTTEYPAPFSEVNLFAMDTLRKAFSLPVGFSDHTQGIAVTLAAVARGASLIEKHFTLDRDMQGPDHQASIEPAELQALVKGTREIEMALGKSSKMPSQSELENRVIARKSIVASRKINTGERFSEENMTCKRPGEGISPMFYWEICGLMARSIIEKDDFIKL